MKRTPRTVMVFTGSRAEYGLLAPVLGALKAHPGVRLRLVVAGGHWVGALGRSASEIERDGFAIEESIRPCRLLGRPQRVVLECADIQNRMARLFERGRPDWLLVLGDRPETFAAVSAAFCAGVAVAHMAGGDLTQGGMKDDCLRHAISKLAHLHFPFTAESARNLRALGEEPWRIVTAGSPAVEVCRRSRVGAVSEAAVLARLGLKPGEPFVLFTQHAVGGQEARAAAQLRASLEALRALGLPVVICAPNHDPGWREVLASFGRFATVKTFRFAGHLGGRDYWILLRRCAAVAGNSSSGILETPIARVPAVDIGDRQRGRRAMPNVLHAPCETKKILAALRCAVGHARFRAAVAGMRHPFGSGRTSQIIARTLADTPPDARVLCKKTQWPGRRP